MSNFLLITQIVLGLLLSVTVLLQNKGEGLSSTWGGSGMGYHSKRGVEKLLMRSTIILAILFILTSIVAALIPA